MVAFAGRLNMLQLLALSTVTGEMGGLVLGLGVVDAGAEAKAKELAANGKGGDGLAILGLVSMREYFSEKNPTDAEARRYLAACCRAWLKILEGN